MCKLSIFTLEQHEGPYETWPIFTKLYADGQWTGSSVRGFLIVRQYQLPDGYLLITSDDCPYEEATHFTLLASNFRVLSDKSLWVPYGSYLFEDATRLDGQQLHVTFVDGESWIVTIQSHHLFGLLVRLRRSR